MLYITHGYFYHQHSQPKYISNIPYTSSSCSEKDAGRCLHWLLDRKKKVPSRWNSTCIHSAIVLSKINIHKQHMRTPPTVQKNACCYATEFYKHPISKMRTPSIDSSDESMLALQRGRFVLFLQGLKMKSCTHKFSSCTSSK